MGFLHMSFFHGIVLLDRHLLLFINGLHNPFFDTFMFNVSKVPIWIPLYLSLLYVIIKYAKKDAIWLILGIVLCVVFADHISSGFLKNAVQRFRPTHKPALEGLVHLVNGYRSGLYGFVSSHASNTFGVALLSSLILRNKVFNISIFSWSLLNCYSRMYLGVHYPLDILGGIIVGTVVALAIYYLLKKLMKKPVSFTVSNKIAVIPVIVLSATVAGLLIYSI